MGLVAAKKGQMQDAATTASPLHAGNERAVSLAGPHLGGEDGLARRERRCPESEYIPALNHLLLRMAAIDADVVVAEAGASPLEPYNGAAAIAALREHSRCMVLCAADPYSVVGVMRAFDREPDVVCGLATSTEAGIELVEKLSGLPALDVLDPAARPRMKEILEKSLDLR
jgi:hypothetical protein